MLDGLPPSSLWGILPSNHPEVELQDSVRKPILASTDKLNLDILFRIFD